MTAKPAETGVRVGIAAIAMTFAALTSAVVVRQAGAPDWRHFQLPPLLYFNTVMLLASSFTLESARRRFARAPEQAEEGARGAGGAALRVAPQVLSGLYVTLVLGLLFVCGQLVAWRSLAAEGLFLSTSPTSSFFYLFTALHGVHVLGGVGALLYVLHRLTSTAPPAPQSALGAAAMYWHFMGALWLYLLLLLATRV